MGSECTHRRRRRVDATRPSAPVVGRRLRPVFARSLGGIVVALLVVTWWAPVAQADPGEATRDASEHCRLLRDHRRYTGGRGDVYRRCPLPENHHWVACESENFLGRRSGYVLVSADDPDWWLEEIHWETQRPDGDSCALAEHPPRWSCEQEREREREEDGYEYSSSSFPPDDCWGAYPTGMYELSWESGGVFDFGKWDNRLLGWTGSFMWTLGTRSISGVLWLVDYGVTFDLREVTDEMTGLAGNYQVRFVVPFRLRDMAWLVLVGWVGFVALRGRIGTALGEVAMTILLLILATVLYQGRGDYLSSLTRAVDQTSHAVLVAGDDRDPAEAVDVADVLAPLQREVHRQFVEAPHAELNWGRNLSRADECVQTASRILSTGWDGAGWPNRFMWGTGNAIRGRHRGENPCADAAAYNSDASKERMFGALLTMLVSFLIAVTLGVLAFTALVCKLVLVLLFAVMPFMLVAAVLPATGRRPLWWWCGSVVQAGATQIGASGAMSIVLMGTEAMGRAMEDMALAERWGIMLAVVFIAYVGMKKLLGGTQAAVTGLADTLTRASPGAAHWSGGSHVGFDFNALPRAAEATALEAGRTGMMAATYNAAVVGRLLNSPARAGREGLFNLMRDRRTKRYGAMNLRDNRMNLAQHARRPRHQVTVQETHRESPAGADHRSSPKPGVVASPEGGSNPQPPASAGSTTRTITRTITLDHPVPITRSELHSLQQGMATVRSAALGAPSAAQELIERPPPRHHGDTLTETVGVRKYGKGEAANRPDAPSNLKRKLQTRWPMRHRDW
jgi:hypothetical protein